MEEVLYHMMAEKQSKRQEGDRDMRPTGYAHSDSIGYLSSCCAKILGKVFYGGRIYFG